MAEPKKIIQSSLKTQSAWLLFAKVAGFGFAFVLPLIVVRVLSQEEFGVYRQSFLVIMNAVAILPVGISMSAYYYLARDESRRSAAVLNILIVHFIVGLAAFLTLFFFPGVLGKIFNSSEMIRLAPAIGLAVWLWLFSVFLEHAAVAHVHAPVLPRDAQVPRAGDGGIPLGDELAGHVAVGVPGHDDDVLGRPVGQSFPLDGLLAALLDHLSDLADEVIVQAAAFL